jgi:hypothetical protein
MKWIFEERKTQNYATPTQRKRVERDVSDDTGRLQQFVNHSNTLFHDAMRNVFALRHSLICDARMRLSGANFAARISRANDVQVPSRMELSPAHRFHFD